ncbi:hypothetical protein L4D09_18470 [Photobacterium makurazakiensis]|uniref:hypothetical protein n=1 Tax=Photobacterium makurazakiensis TaxID=2910234 RepID=UPI003D0EE00B
MRKTNIALLIAVVASPLALANSYDPYGGYGNGYDSYDNGNTITDSFNKDLDASLTKTYDSEYTVKDSYNSDDDKLLMYDVNNTDKHEYIDNSTHDYSQDWDIKIEDNYNMATSNLDGMVTYSEVTYGGACCDGGGHYGRGYGGPSAPSSVTVMHHNDMSGAFNGASGINLAGQNAGNNSLLQQTASTNATLAGN